MFWLVFAAIAFAVALIKLGALSVWVTVLSAATKALAILCLAMLGLLVLRVVHR